MAKRLENPNEDDIGLGGVELTEDEFKQFLWLLGQCGLATEDVARVLAAGFVSGLKRDQVTEQIFAWLMMPPDVRLASICRVGSLDAMKAHIQHQFSELRRQSPPTDL